MPPAERVTMRPDEIDTSSAGTCDTRPSPTVRRLNVLMASPIGRPICTTPMTKPPIRLTIVITRPAIASPFTNFEAPSIAP